MNWDISTVTASNRHRERLVGNLYGYRCIAPSAKDRKAVQVSAHGSSQLYPQDGKHNNLRDKIGKDDPRKRSANQKSCQHPMCATNVVLTAFYHSWLG